MYWPEQWDIMALKELIKAIKNTVKLLIMDLIFARADE